MPIIFDEVTANITPPAPATSAPADPAGTNGGPAPDPQTLQRELQRIAERAARLSAD
jgi:hypothetical protein